MTDLNEIKSLSERFLSGLLHYIIPVHADVAAASEYVFKDVGKWRFLSALIESHSICRHLD